MTTKTKNKIISTAAAARVNFYARIQPDTEFERQYAEIVSWQIFGRWSWEFDWAFELVPA